MGNKKLSFCDLKHLDNEICEVVVFDGLEIDDAMVDEYHDYLDGYYTGAFALLINKKNNYTYSFSAQQRIASLPNIKAMAVVVYKRSTEIATQALSSIQRSHHWNLKTFYDRDEALTWLNSELTAERSVDI